MPTPFRPSALLFDMDGLLVDSEPLWWRLERELAHARGGRWTDEDALGCVGKGIPSTLRMMKDELGLSIDLTRDHAWFIETFIARVDELQLKPGATELLDRAEGVVGIALASSSPHNLIDAVLRRFDLGPRFEVRVSGETMPHPKPAPDIFLRAAELLGHAPSRCVVLEDSLAGARAGRAAGAFVIAVPEGTSDATTFTEVADVIATDLFEAAAHLDLTRR